MVLAVGLSACQSYKNFQYPKTLVNSTQIQGQKLVSEAEIRANIPSLSNSYQRIFPPKLYLYLKTRRERKDPEGNKPKFLRFFTEANPDFNLEESRTQVQQIQSYLRKNGFLKSQVSLRLDSSRIQQGLLNLIFEVKEGPLSLFTKEDSLLVNNPVLSGLVREYLQTESLIQKNRFLNVEVLKKEKENLSTYLKNKGYFYFNNEALGIQINDLKDTTLEKISLVYKIPDFKNNNYNRYYDRIFRFQRPLFYVGTENKQSETQYLEFKAFQIPPLERLFNVKEGEVYAPDRVNQGLQNIYLTDQFKSVSIHFDTSRTNLYPRIDLVRNDKYNFSTELGGSVFRGIPGPFITNSFKVRRLFGALDYLDLSARLGLEAQPGFINTEQTRKNLELNLNASINFPTLFLPNKLADQLGRIFVPQTQLGIGYDYINRPEYIRTNARLFQRYQWRKGSHRFFSLSLLDLNVINTLYPNTSTANAFQVYLNELRLTGNNLYRSFNPSFVSSIHFEYAKRNINAGNALVNGNSSIIGLESGGTSLNFIGSKRLGFVERMFGDQSNIQFYRFLRVNYDFRSYRLLGVQNKSQLAFKLNFGMAYAYSPENEYQLPYEKNFFIGGPSSLRAWKPRRLGPGSSNFGNELIERPGSILLESSLEYRFKLIDFIGTMNAAFFVDAGNIWNFANPFSAEEGHFRLNRFYEQLALGSGFGLRWDLTYFLLRLDMATKVLDPSQAGSHWVLDKTTFKKSEHAVQFNIGIGYPF